MLEKFGGEYLAQISKLIDMPEEGLASEELVRVTRLDALAAQINTGEGDARFIPGGRPRFDFELGEMCFRVFVRENFKEGKTELRGFDIREGYGWWSPRLK